MKAVHALPPLVAAAVVGYWNFQSWQAIHTLTAECLGLQRRISTTRLPAAPEDPAKQQERRTQAGTLWEGKPLDLHYLLSQTRLQRDSLGRHAIDERYQQHLHSRIEEMGGQELAMVLDEIDALGLDPADRALLEGVFFHPFIYKEPVLALERLAGRIRDDPDGRLIDLQPAMEAWVKLDPAAATAWFDRAITAGVFESKRLDGRCWTRLKFEAVLAQSLLVTDTSAAARRIMALPEVRRGEALRYISFGEMDPETLKRYVELTRGELVTNKAGEPFAAMIGRKIGGDFAKADSFLDEIGATPEERAAAAGAVVEARMRFSDGRTTPDGVAVMRSWLDKQAPEQINRLTGAALGEASGSSGVGFFKMVQQVEELHLAGGGDELLIGFIEHRTTLFFTDTAKRLAERITDPQRRAAMFKLINEGQ